LRTSNSVGDRLISTRQRAKQPANDVLRQQRPQESSIVFGHSKPFTLLQWQPEIDGETETFQ
jgi:hypothetical protein